MANTKDKPIKKEDLRFILQRAETQQDSLTQKLQRRLGKNNELSRQAFYVLKEIRKAQFRYLPVSTHSLLRYNDCGVNEDGTFKRPIMKNNWRKYKREKEREKLVKLN